MDLISRVASRYEFELRFPFIRTLEDRIHIARADVTMPREFYLPKDFRGKPSIKPPGTDLEIWTWMDDRPDSKGYGKMYGIAFQGKANKPLWYYTFKDQAGLWKQINESVEIRREQLKRKQEEALRRKNEQHGLKEGDILYSSWGYDQTNVDFYQVTKVIGKAVVIRAIASKVVREERGAEYVAAVPGKFTGPEEKKLPRGEGDAVSIKLNSFSYARKWDGKPKYQTATGWGH
jgi:hypothetical protein